MILAFVVGVQYVFVRFPRFRLPEKYDDRRLIVLSWVLLMAHAAYLLIPSLNQIPSIGQFLLPAGFVSISIFYFLWSERRLDTRHLLFILFVVLPLVLIERLTQGLLTAIFLYALLAFFLLLKNHPWKALTIGAGVGAVLLTSYGPFTVIREKVRGAPDFLLASPMEQVQQFPHLLSFEPKDYRRLNPVDSAQVVLRRTALLPLYAMVAERSPEEVPYWKGETYRPILTSIVLRFLWPEKPREVYGNVFGHRYGMLTERHWGMSVNIPWIVEMRACLTSAPLGHLSLFLNGGFGSSRFDVKPLVVDGSSGGF